MYLVVYISLHHFLTCLEVRKERVSQGTLLAFLAAAQWLSSEPLRAALLWDVLHRPGESKGQRCEEKGGTDMGGKSSMEIKPLSIVNGADPQCLYMAMSPLILVGTGAQVL